MDVDLTQLTPGKTVTTVNDIPFNDLFRKGYTIGIGILDPQTEEPGIELAMNNVTRMAQYYLQLLTEMRVPYSGGMKAAFVRGAECLRDGEWEMANKDIFRHHSVRRISEGRCDGLRPFP